MLGLVLELKLIENLDLSRFTFVSFHERAAASHPIMSNPAAVESVPGVPASEISMRVGKSRNGKYAVLSHRAAICCRQFVRRAQLRSPRRFSARLLLSTLK